MNEEIGRMVSTRIQPIEMAVKHMGEPCKWVPLTIMTWSESPKDPRKTYSPLHLGVFSDVQIIIKIYESIISYLPIGYKAYQDKKKTDKKLQDDRVRR